MSNRFNLNFKINTMKRNIKYWGLCLFLAAGLTSCESDEADYQKDAAKDVGGYAFLANQTISSFDKSEDLSIDLYTDSGVTVNSVEVLQEGSSIASATVGEETATFNSSSFGDIAIDDEFDIMLESQLSNGNMAQDPFTVSVVSPISIDDDNPSELTLDSISDGAAVDYSTYTLSAPIDTAELFLKKNSDGTYSNSGAEVSNEGGSIELADTNYDELNLMVNDTLYYEFTVMSGSLSESESSYIVIQEEEEEEME